ncbi:MAG: 2-hydroxyacyl-CoA dehydratase [Candidatus Heimdallarchaeota archaeon]|nr:2-hydroxyacyl-CoA dehydratase [Candidatus Heimdallarchaeota archaeon]
MNTTTYIVGSSPIDEIIRLAGYDVKHVWNISESRNYNEISFLPQQFCQLSKHILYTLIQKIHNKSSNLLIMSSCSELNRFHSLLDELCEHDFIEIPRSNREHAVIYLEKQIENYINNNESIKSVPVEQLNQEINDRLNLVNFLKETHMSKRLKYVDLLSSVQLILDREAKSFQQNIDEIKSKFNSNNKKETEKKDKPSILILGEFWCQEITEILEEIDKSFEIKSDSFENGLGFLYEKYEEIPIIDMQSYITYVAQNTLKSKFNPSLLDFEVEEIKAEIDENNIEGIVIINYKFCDVFTFLAPLLNQIPEFDIPILELELESEGLGFEQIKTRLEALNECLLDRRK